MGKILPFTCLPRSTSRKPGDASAEIVIFPGVRVEYHDQPPAPAGKGGPSRRGRRPQKAPLSA
jgi:hypothetical protein